MDDRSGGGAQHCGASDNCDQQESWPAYTHPPPHNPSLKDTLSHLIANQFLTAYSVLIGLLMQIHSTPVALR